MAERRRHSRSWQLLVLLGAFTILVGSRAEYHRARQTEAVRERVSAQDPVANDRTTMLPGSDDSGNNPLLSMRLGENSGFGPLGDEEEGEVKGAYPKTLNDFYKGMVFFCCFWCDCSSAFDSCRVPLGHRRAVPREAGFPCNWLTWHRLWCVSCCPLRGLEHEERYRRTLELQAEIWTHSIPDNDTSPWT